MWVRGKFESYRRWRSRDLGAFSPFDAPGPFHVDRLGIERAGKRPNLSDEGRSVGNPHQKRFLLVALGTVGDVAPQMALAARLRARGHEVAFLSQEAHRPLITAAGFPFTALDNHGSEKFFTENAAVVGGNVLKTFRLVASRGFLPHAERVFQHLKEREDPARTLVVAGSFAWGARLAREQLGFRVVTIHLQPTLLANAPHPPTGFRVPRWIRALLFRAAESLLIDPVLAPALDRIAAKPLHLSRVLSRWNHSPDGVLCLFPEWLADSLQDLPPNSTLAGFVGGPGASVPRSLPDWLSARLDAGERPVVVTAGTGINAAKQYFAAAADACAKLGIPALFVTRAREQLPACLPSCVTHVDYVDFAALLPRVSALVHPGGIGTIANAVAAGCPQLIVPFTSDQPENAGRLRDLGLAISIKPRSFTGARAAKALRRLLDDTGLRERTARLAPTIEFEASAETACAFLESRAPALMTRSSPRHRHTWHPARHTPETRVA